MGESLAFSIILFKDQVKSPTNTTNRYGIFSCLSIFPNGLQQPNIGNSRFLTYVIRGNMHCNHRAGNACQVRRGCVCLRCSGKIMTKQMFGRCFLNSWSHVGPFEYFTVTGYTVLTMMWTFKQPLAGPVFRVVTATAKRW